MVTKTTFLAHIILLVTVCLPIQAQAQSVPPGNVPREPVNSGVIILPPETDTKAVKKPPANVDPGIIGAPDSGMKTEPARRAPDTSRQQEKNSMSCDTPTAPCK